MTRFWLAALMCALSLTAARASAGAERVVGVGAAVTEIIYALGAGDRLVGVDTQSIYPPEARMLPQVGYVRQLSIEGLASLAPDLVIAAADVGPPQVVDRLRQMGVRLAIAEPAETIEAAVERIRAVGLALGLDARGEALARDVGERAERARQRFAQAGGPLRPRVVLFLGRGAGSPSGAGAATVGDAMIRLAGGENALAEMEGFKPVPAESLIAAAPDVVVVTQQMVEQAGSLEALARGLPGLAQTPAAAAGRIVVMDILELFSFGPRLPEAVERLGAAIHPAAPAVVSSGTSAHARAGAGAQTR